MKLIEFIRPRLKLLFKLYLFVLFIFLLQIILSYVFVYKASLTQIETRLRVLSERIQKDLQFNGNTWDTSRYNSDPLTPYPNGSSGFLNPLYIITKEGFIIERSSPIHGLLDASDFKHLIQFQTPQTIDTITNEKWRVLSKPIESNGTTLGVVVVSYYNPSEGGTSLIDRKMRENIGFITSQLYVKNNKISTNKLDIRNIHYEFSFEVVDIYNNVLINNGRVPTFIDTSYFAQEVEAHPHRLVYDTKTGAQYVVVSSVIKNNKSEAQGLIVAGEPVQSLFLLLQNYVLFAIILSSICIIPLLVYVAHIFRIDIVSLLADKLARNDITQIRNISFNKKGSYLEINGRKYEIPYASNQYYICEAVFSAPQKKWEHDELLEKLGDHIDEDMNSRKVYDAVLAINKKSGYKIIEYKNKVFMVNPILHNTLSKK